MKLLVDVDATECLRYMASKISSVLVQVDAPGAVGMDVSRVRRLAFKAVYQEDAPLEKVERLTRVREVIEVPYV